MPVQGLNFTVQSGFEAHQSYQSTGSFTVYNPNDGVAFIATDRTANGLSWDYKVPSQSGGKFPGPINSYLSIFYLDQSGGGAPGQVVVYASTEVVNIPYFWSIGRAIQLQSTSLDIVTGSQPGNPGAGISRLWVDGAGHLNILQSTGANSTVYDTTNIGTVTLGGDLYGSISAGHVGLQQGSGIAAYDTGNNLREMMMNNGSEVLFWCVGGSQYRWVNQLNSVEWMRLDGSASGLTVQQNVNAHNVIASANMNALGGTYYMRNDNAVYIQWDGAHVHTNQPFLCDSYIVATTSLSANGGIVYLRSDNAIYISWRSDLGSVYFPQNIYPAAGMSVFGLAQFNGAFVLQQGISPAAAQSGTLYWHNNQTVYTYLNYPYLYFQNCHPTADQFIISGSGYSYIAFGRGAANEISANVHLYVPGNIAYGGSIGPASTIRVKKNLVAIEPIESLTLILDPRASSYRYEPIEAPPENSNEAHPQRIGFIAEEMLTVVPEVVVLDAEGLPASMDYTQLVPLLWGAIRQLDARLSKLEFPAA